MKTQLLTFHTSHCDYLKLAVAQYEKKINGFLKFEYKVLKSKPFPRGEESKKIQWESEKLLSQLKPGEGLLLFDEEGMKLSSEKFSQSLVKQLGQHSNVTFVIGGAYGVSEGVKKRANLCLSLSSFVLNHHVAQVVALEQIYRALSIWKNTPYHNA